MQIGLNLEASFCPLSDKPVQAILEHVSDGCAYLTTDQPPRAGDIVRVMAGTSVQSIGSVLGVQHIDASRYRFSVQLFQLNESGQAGSSPSEWEFEPKGIKEGSFRYFARLRKVKDYVQEHYSEEIPLAKISRIAAMEKSYFSTFFRQKVGVTYHKWLQAQRVTKAIETMKNENSSITDICFSVGFGDLRTFERAFKRWTGLTPRVFKKMVSPLLVFSIVPLTRFFLA